MNMTREEAIAKVVQQNNAVENLFRQIEVISQESAKRCQNLQNQANQIVGRNDAIRELFELTTEELEAAVKEDQEKRTKPPEKASTAAKKTPPEKIRVVDKPPVE